MSNDWQDSSTGGQPPKQGMSTALKVVLILVALFGGVCLLCCGGMMWFGWRVQNTVVQDPEQVRAVAGEIVAIEVPEGFEPAGAMDFGDIPIFGSMIPGGMKMVFYKGPGDGVLMLMEMGREMFQGQPDPAAQMQQAMRQQGQNSRNVEIDDSSIESREFEIRGKKVPFQFAQGKDQQGGKAFRQITGSFDGDNGVVMLMLQVPDENYDEAQVVKMLESIK